MTLLVALGWLIYTNWQQDLLSVSVRGLVLFLLPFALSLIGLGLITKLVTVRKSAQQVLVGLGIVTVGALLARLHLHVFDKLFLWQGRLRRFVDRA